MIEPGVLTFTTGTAGQSGTTMQADATVSGGAVTAITITSQGENVKLNDVLIVDDLIINHPDLTIPHSQLHHRLFVLKPLMQLCPNLVVPAKGQLSYLYDCLIQADSSQVVVNRGALETFTTH